MNLIDLIGLLFARKREPLPVESEAEMEAREAAREKQNNRTATMKNGDATRRLLDDVLRRIEGRDGR